MPSRKNKKIRVLATAHAKKRWIERSGRSVKKLDQFMTSALNDQLGVGVPVYKGQLLLNLPAEKFDLATDLVAPLELPDLDGIWRAVTVRPKGG